MPEESNDVLSEHVNGFLGASVGVRSVAATHVNVGEVEQLALHGRRRCELSTALEGRVSRLVASWQGGDHTPLQSRRPRVNSAPSLQGVAARQATTVGPARHFLARSSKEPPGTQTCSARSCSATGLGLSQMEIVPGCEGMRMSAPSTPLSQATTMRRDASGELLQPYIGQPVSIPSSTSPDSSMIGALSMPTPFLGRRVMQGEFEFRMLSPTEIADMLKRGEETLLQTGSPRIVNLLDFGSSRTGEAEDEEERATGAKRSSLGTSSQSGSDREDSYWESDAVDCALSVTHGFSHTIRSLALAEPRSLRCSCNMVVLGVTGGAAGAVAGSAMGAVLGIPTAMMTLGLSVPVCSGAGATAGLCTGSIIGSVAGARGTNIAVVYEDEPASSPEFENSNSSRLIVCIDNERTDAHSRRRAMTLASAFGGSVVMGSLGGASGTAVGGLVGATLGLVPAPFTLGLSIPIGATIGTSMGFLTGTLAGASAGFLGGGVAAKSSFAYADMRMAVAG